jgi:hypothetical protein
MKRTNNYLSYIVVGLLLFAAPTLTGAARLTSEINQANLRVGDSFTIALSLDSEESINALEGTFSFPKEKLTLTEIRKGNSIVTFWVDEPKEVDGGVRFSGIIPGGYTGVNRSLFTLVFEVQREGVGTATLIDSRALLHDGEGSTASLTFTPLELIFLPRDGEQKTIPVLTDTEPPETFQPTIATDPSIFDGHYFLAFATQDKGSGIDHYEVAETRGWFPWGWRETESPYLLSDQKLTSDVYIKAIDEAGNERVAVFHRERFARSYELLIGGILIVLLAALLVRRLRT